MKSIAIIGATGNMGTGISTALAKANYSLHLYAPDREALVTHATKLQSLGDGRVATHGSSLDAATAADIIILAVWHGVQPGVAEEIASATSGKIVVSIANPLNETFDGLTTAPGTSSAEELAVLLPSARIVKAFNTVLAADFAGNVIDGNQIDCFVAGDDDQAVTEVNELVTDAGFRPLVAGKLQKSGVLEQMTLLLIGLSQRYEYNWHAGWKVLG